MYQKNKNNDIIYRKLVRDKIPEIIKKHGKTPFSRKLEGKAYREAVGRKILEEAYELFSKWVKKDPKGILKESADMLEITLAALKEHGYDLDDLLTARQNWAKERGQFNNKIFLENVGKASVDDIKSYGAPVMFFSPYHENQLIDLVNTELSQSESAWIVSAFYTPGITNLLISSFERFIESGGALKILLSTMGNMTRPEYFIHLKTFIPGADLKVFHPPELPFNQSPPDFHVKIYLFRRRSGIGAMLIGSSNFTEAGFIRNIEWNYFTPGEINLPFDDVSPFQAAINEFDRYWNNTSVDITDDFIAGYKQRWQSSFELHPQTKRHVLKQGKYEISDGQKTWSTIVITPNDVQKEALENLAVMRSQGVHKAAIIAATGVGKTYLSAFDFQQSSSQRLLYIAHRENILKKSIDSFKNVLGDDSFGEIFGGGKAVSGKNNGVFAMIQTLSKVANMNIFAPGEFDYIVMDEFHHSEAPTYRRVLNYFRPKFFIGLTATPERMDGRDVLAYCDYNVGYEVRILEAVDRGWLAPFQYYAIYDETDYSQITWRGTRYDEAELDKALIDDTRTKIIAKNLKKYLPSQGKIKALAFCSSIAHAKYTARHLSQNHDIESVSLVGLSSEVERETAIDRLQSEDDPLEVICSVDIFNEGIDIPEVTHVLFLRPTQSFTIFIQQLGRGLRSAPGKEFVVALDFVGNFKKAHVAPLALQGFTSAQEYQSTKKDERESAPPKGCYISADLEVQRIWRDELNRVLKGRKKEDQLKELYWEIRGDLERNPTIMDFYANPHDVDPYIFVKIMGGWLRAKKTFDDITPEEEKLIDTPGEQFLTYLEKDLSPTKCYKFIVLRSILQMPGTSWNVSEIAKKFLYYFLTHRHHLHDYDDLAKSSNPQEFPLKKVESKLRKMPLDKLSYKEIDWFVLKGDTFSLKPEIHDHWNDKVFKEMVRDRVEFGLARYFQRYKKSMTIKFNKSLFNDGFALEKNFALEVTKKNPLDKGESRPVVIYFDGNEYEAKLYRLPQLNRYQIRYSKNNPICKFLKKRLEGIEKGSDAFQFVSKDQSTFRIEIGKS